MTSDHKRIAFGAINCAALANIDRILSRWLPGGRCEGAEYVVKNPKRADRKAGSFKVNTNSGRWADFAAWVTAAEPGLGWPEGSFLPLYAANRDEAVQASLEADPLALATLKLLEDKFQWEGPANQLLSDLEELVSDKIKKAKWWPSTPAMLSKQLERAAPILRIHGIEFERRKGGASSSRTIYLERVPQKEV